MYVVVRAAALLALSLASFGVTASTVADIDVTCPIGGKHFKTLLAMSGTQFGQNLDLRPFGAIISPWPIPKCPENGFVMYKKTFSQDEIKRLNIFVLSDAYQSLQKTETNYYLAATLMKYLGEPKKNIAYALLEATWETENDPKYAKYAGEALGAFESLADPSSGATSEDISFYQILAGEMERRLGRFDAAKHRFETLLTRADVPGTVLEQIARQEMALVALKDSATHPVTDTTSKKK